MHEKEELQALLDAGIVRLRPVMITVGATSLAVFPLAVPASGSENASTDLKGELP